MKPTHKPLRPFSDFRQQVKVGKAVGGMGDI